MTLTEALTEAKAAARSELPEDLIDAALMDILHLSSLIGQARRRAIPPAARENAAATFTAWLAGDIHR